MKTLILCCGCRDVRCVQRAADRGVRAVCRAHERRMADLAKRPAVPATSRAMPAALAERLEFPLELNKPVEIAPLGVKVTLLEAERLRR
ncbi:MAG: hypothetical protein H6701_11040 [Myxococcales bacterium]|nr:hypothetical protein [Myxococcales bacterium]